MIKVKKSAIGIFLCLQLIVLAAALSCPMMAKTASAKAVNTSDYNPEPLEFIPQVSIPNSEFNAGASTMVGSYNESSSTMTSDLLPRYIMSIYNYALAIAGILAAIVLMGGGVIWLASSGDAGKVSKAKELIAGSISGLLILAAAWIILNTVNPNLVNLKGIETKNVYKDEILICCDAAQGETRTMVRIIGDKKIALEGDNKGKEINCGSKTECSAGHICGQGKDKTYQCILDNVCCQCGRGSVTGYEKFYWSCKNNMTIKTCNDWCLTFLNSTLGTGGVGALFGLDGNVGVWYYEDSTKYSCTENAYSSCKLK